MLSATSPLNNLGTINASDYTGVISDASSITTRAPGKLILSGEHAVVYGYPALAIAVDLYAESIVSKNSNTTNNILGFDFANLKYNAKHTFNTLRKLKDKAYLDYNRFLKGECTIREVVHKPFELLQFAVSNFLDQLNIVLPTGIDIKTRSNIPSGCGMGSSSATIMSLLYAVGSLLDLDISKSKYIELGRDAENLQHGSSSGFDIQLAVHGGCLKYNEGCVEKLKDFELTRYNFYIINTGRPDVTTGQCVSTVRKYFNSNSSLGKDFADLTNSLEKILYNNNSSQLSQDLVSIIRANHELLCHIGVVPHKVNSFISQIEQYNCAAKICGAGAVSGDNAGAVLLLCPDLEHLNSIKSLTDQYGYEIKPVGIDNHGIRVL